MKYLKPSEVADILSVSPPTVISMCARGELPGSKQVGKGKRWRIPETAVSTVPTGPTETIPKPFDVHSVFDRWEKNRTRKPK